MRMRNTGKGWLAAVLCASALAAPAQDAADLPGTAVLDEDNAQAIEIEADIGRSELSIEFDRPMRIWDNRIDPGQIRTEPELPLRCDETAAP